jgi:glutamyl-tRNA synthetase
MAPYCGRFAPSPTGALHLGTARTALLAWARARRASGRFLLRLEDLDAPRVRAGAAQGLLEDLRWLGLDWDAGPGGGGGPWEQSRRLASYQDALQALHAKGALFACSCSRRDLEGSASAPHGEDGVLYPGRCRAGAQAGRPWAWRLRMGGPEAFDDAWQGPQAGLQDDFVVRRADGVFSYQLACAVDDAAMGVTEVVRGRDLLGSASRQQALLKALGLPVPAWAHAPLLLGPDGARLAKRHGAVSVAAFRQAGFSPGRLRGLLASTLGWSGPHEELSLAETLARARFDALGGPDAAYSLGGLE